MEILRDQVSHTELGEARFDEVLMGECETCQIRGECCRIFAIPLTYDESLHLEVDPWTKKHKRIIMIRRRDDGACWYLGDDGKCTIHDRRPIACREYTCVGDEWLPVLIKAGLGKTPMTPKQAARIIKKEMKIRGLQ